MTIHGFIPVFSATTSAISMALSLKSGPGEVTSGVKVVTRGINTETS